MKTKKVSLPIENVGEQLLTGSSTFTLRDIKNELEERAKNTGNPFYFLIKVDKDGDALIVKTQDREEIRNIVGEKESEKRERVAREDWEKTIQKGYLRKVTIQAIFEGLKNLIKRIEVGLS